jgi:hypothetical protein
MEEIKDEKEIIITFIEDFLCDAVRNIQTSTPDLIDYAIDTTIKDFTGVIQRSATKLSRIGFVLAQPIIRPRHYWYTKRCKGLCRTFVAKTNALGLKKYF